MRAGGPRWEGVILVADKITPGGIHDHHCQNCQPTLSSQRHRRPDPGIAVLPDVLVEVAELRVPFRVLAALNGYSIASRRNGI
jgi:hypothetical protein